MVCRVFQKSLQVKRPQQTPSSQPESPCDTASMVNEFGDVELPNLINNIANSSSDGITNNISGQTFFNADLINSVNTNMNLAMNWPVASEVIQVPTLPSLPWPSGLLNPSISVNSLLLKALQLRSYQQIEAAAAAATDHLIASYMPQGVSQHVGTNLISSSLTASSSSKVLECVPQQQQEQPFNLDSIW